MVFKLKTSKETMKIFEEMGASIRLQPFALCKLAVALSLRDHAALQPEDFKTNNEGLELNRQTITAEYDDLFKALIISHTGRALSDEEYFPKYLKAHIDRGTKMLYSEFKYSGSKFYKHLTELEKGV
jgi:DNA sulfur modification protein DndE